MMNKSMKILAVMALFGSLTAHAALVVYEGFDYSGASDVDGENGGTGWAGAWGINGGSPSVVSIYDGTSLSNGAFTGAGFTPVGGSMSNNHNTFGGERTFASALSMTVDEEYYFSFLIRYPEQTEAVSTQLSFTGNANPVFVRFNQGDASVTVGPGTFSSTGSEGYTDDTTYFVVGKITASAGGTDSISINVFDNAESVPVSESFLITSGGASLSGSITGIQFTQGDLQNNDGNPASFDEFRLGTTWESVAIPEPSSLALVGLTLAAGMIGMRRRRSSSCR